MTDRSDSFSDEEKSKEARIGLLSEDVEPGSPTGVAKVRDVSAGSLREKAINAFCITLNTASTVGIVFLNKS